MQCCREARTLATVLCCMLPRLYTEHHRSTCNTWHDVLLCYKLFVMPPGLLLISTNTCRSCARMCSSLGSICVVCSTPAHVCVFCVTVHAWCGVSMHQAGILSSGFGFRLHSIRADHGRRSAGRWQHHLRVLVTVRAMACPVESTFACTAHILATSSTGVC